MKEEDEFEEICDQTELHPTTQKCAIKTCQNRVCEATGIKLGTNLICKACYHEPLRVKEILTLIRGN